MKTNEDNQIKFNYIKITIKYLCKTYHVKYPIIVYNTKERKPIVKPKCTEFPRPFIIVVPSRFMRKYPTIEAVKLFVKAFFNTENKYLSMSVYNFYIKNQQRYKNVNKPN